MAGGSTPPHILAAVAALSQATLAVLGHSFSFSETLSAGLDAEASVVDRAMDGALGSPVPTSASLSSPPLSLSSSTPSTAPPALTAAVRQGLLSWCELTLHAAYTCTPHTGVALPAAVNHDLPDEVLFAQPSGVSLDWDTWRSVFHALHIVRVLADPACAPSVHPASTPSAPSLGSLSLLQVTPALKAAARLLGPSCALPSLLARSRALSRLLAPAFATLFLHLAAPRGPFAPLALARTFASPAAPTDAMCRDGDAHADSDAWAVLFSLQSGARASCLELAALGYRLGLTLLRARVAVARVSLSPAEVRALAFVGAGGRVQLQADAKRESASDGEEDEKEGDGNKVEEEAAEVIEARQALARAKKMQRARLLAQWQLQELLPAALRAVLLASLPGASSCSSHLPSPTYTRTYLLAFSAVTALLRTPTPPEARKIISQFLEKESSRSNDFFGKGPVSDPTGAEADLPAMETGSGRESPGARALSELLAHVCSGLSAATLHRLVSRLAAHDAPEGSEAASALRGSSSNAGPRFGAALDEVPLSWLEPAPADLSRLARGKGIGFRSRFAATDRDSLQQDSVSEAGEERERGLDDHKSARAFPSTEVSYHAEREAVRQRAFFAPLACVLFGHVLELQPVIFLITLVEQCFQITCNRCWRGAGTRWLPATSPTPPPPSPAHILALG